MPIIAVGAAIYAGTTIATVGLAAMSALQIVSAVGAIASGIGVVTGNEKLAKIGAIAGLVGGVGAFAQGQGWLGAAKSATGGATGGASNIGTMAAEAAPGIVDPAANLAASAPAATGAALEAGSNVAGSAASSAGSGLMGAPLSSLVAQEVGSFGNVAQVAAGPTSTSSSIFNTLNDVGSFMNKNKEMSSMASNFVGGMFDDKKKAEAKQAQAATQSELLMQERLRQQMANANAVPDLTGLNVNPNANVFKTGVPPVYQAPRVGLINSTGY